MITFDDVRRTEEETFFFFPDDMYDELEHFLKLANVPDDKYSLMDYATADAIYGRYLTIPSVPTDPELKGIPEAMCDRPCLLVSHMHPDDLERRLWEIHDSPEADAWSQKRTDDIMTAIKERNEALKGWLPGLDRESEDVE